MLAWPDRLMQPDLLLPGFTIVVLILSVILHEVAHGYAAYALGDRTARDAGRLTLNPIAHIDPIGSVLIPATLVLLQSGFMFGWAKPVPYNPYNLRNQRWGEALVAVAGVATNLLVAVVFAMIARATTGTTFGDLAEMVCLVNLFLGFFNLIPIPPLDGFGVLRGLVPGSWGMRLRNFEAYVQRGGFLSLILILVLFSQFLSQPFYDFVIRVFLILIGQ